MKTATRSRKASCPDRGSPDRDDHPSRDSDSTIWNRASKSRVKGTPERQSPEDLSSFQRWRNLSPLVLDTPYSNEYCCQKACSVIYQSDLDFVNRQIKKLDLSKSISASMLSHKERFARKCPGLIYFRSKPVNLYNRVFRKEVSAMKLLSCVVIDKLKNRKECCIARYWLYKVIPRLLITLKEPNHQLIVRNLLSSIEGLLSDYYLIRGKRQLSSCRANHMIISRKSPFSKLTTKLWDGEALLSNCIQPLWCDSFGFACHNDNHTGYSIASSSSQG